MISKYVVEYGFYSLMQLPEKKKNLQRSPLLIKTAAYMRVNFCIKRLNGTSYLQGLIV